MCIVDLFVDGLFSYLINKFDSKHCCAIIKRHNDKFEQYGEFSFPWKINAWRKYITWPSEWENSSDLSIFNITFSCRDSVSLENACKNVIDKSKELSLLIKECKVKDDRVHLYLDRPSLLKTCFVGNGVDLEPCNIKNSKNIFVTIDNGSNNDISYYRLQLISKVTQNIAINEGYHIALEKDVENTTNIHFTCKSSNKSEEALNVICGPVINVKNGLKEKEISTEEYLEKRTIDMQLKAQHKYRIYITDEDLWNKSVKQLGEACAIFDLLQIKPSHSVQISLHDGGIGCSKGASFILYNYARLSSIINTFQQKVAKGLYPKLPDVANINFELLDDEDEWAIIFNFVCLYNSTLHRCISIDSSECQISPHQLCSFLSSLVVKFSLYYRKVRVLLEPRDHLIPKIFARMHLLILIHKILLHGLSLMSIKPLSEM